MERIVVVVAAAFAVLAQAQTYPSKPIRIVSAFGAANASSTALRLVTTKMSESMGQPILIDPQTAASGVGAVTPRVNLD